MGRRNRGEDNRAAFSTDESVNLGGGNEGVPQGSGEPLTPEEIAAALAAEEVEVASSLAHGFDPANESKLDVTVTEGAGAEKVTQETLESIVAEADQIALAPRHQEWHVTVEGSPLAWAEFCQSFSAGYVKPLFIELSNKTTQLMSAMSFDPTLFIEEAHAAGFKVIRVKHEVETLLPGERPLYFETHLKFDGPMRWDRPGTSRDLFRSTGKFDRWYMTKRGKVALFDNDGAPLPAPRPLFDNDKFLEDGPRMAKPSSFAEAESEFCLTDTNPDLDKGWL